MRIHSDFTGGNICVERIEANEVWVRNELRDTAGDWFYWAMCVEGAQGQTITVHLDKKWIGYYGPAVSRDLIHWKWLGSPDESQAGDCFTYTFGPEENRTYFAHDMLYHPSHLDAFLKRAGLEKQTLCLSEAGREVPFVAFGSGEKTVLLTARHHACESTGSYVLEGVLEELYREPIEGLRFIAVPFVDYDGVVDGDQGKSRKPWDHNRDYAPEKESLYASVRAIRRLVGDNRLLYAFDFHSPWHVGERNDRVYIPQKHFSALKQTTRFANLLEKSITPESLPYHASDLFRPGEDWNQIGTPGFSTYMYDTAGAELSFTLETPYFQATQVPYDVEKARELGRCFARALRAYHVRPLRISFTGDLLFQNPMNDWCRTDDGYSYLPLFYRDWGRLPDTDYLVGNLESPVAGEQNGGYTSERYCFNTPEEVLRDLKNAGFDMLSLANNHAMDRGPEGIAATVDACERNGLDHVGLYRTEEESEAVFIRELNGIRVGFVNTTYGTNAFAHHRFLGENQKFMVHMSMPEETLEGSVDLLKDNTGIEQETRALYEPVSPVVQPYLDHLKSMIERTREQADYVIMLLHSGGQYNTETDAYTRMLAEKIRSWGADIIIGLHPHIILPSEVRNGFFTAYCLGNLVYGVKGAGGACPVSPAYSAVVSLELEKKAGKILPKITFRLCHLSFDPEDRRAPVLEDTFDHYREARMRLGEEHPDVRKEKEEILRYANRFFPDGSYRVPMAEYPVL